MVGFKDEGPIAHVALFRDAGYREGVAAYRRGDFAAAIAAFQSQLAHDPRSVLVWRGLGDACLAAARYGDGLAAFEGALRIDPANADAWYDRGTALVQLGRTTEAIDSFGRALASGAQGELAVLACFQRGTTRHLRRELDAALADYDRVLALVPDHADVQLQRALALRTLGHLPEALAAYDLVLRTQPDHHEALVGRARISRDLGALPEALAAIERVHALDAGHPAVRGERLYLKALLHDWAGFAEARAELTAALARDEQAATPFVACVMLGDPVLQRRVAERESRVCQARATTSLPPLAPRVGDGRIRLGYFSADFHHHATTYLMAELFQLHDRARFEVVAFSFGPKVDDGMRQYLTAAFDRFEEVGPSSDLAIAARARALGIDIAVDLKGFTQHERAEIFVHRAAPVQVAYLGYPGTTGAPWIEYLIADRVIVPQGSERHYSEHVVRLPGSYQVNDSRRLIDAPPPPRSELGLPEQGIVFCAFNRSYKTNPELFDSWMRILTAVEGSVLWLLKEHPLASANLRREAAARGVDPKRLVFATKVALDQHLRRQRAADLFLDALPCNAHTTASDALLVGLPVLTQVGESFASRVAASLLHAVGLPELVTTSAAEYEALAIALARDPARRARLREHLMQDPTALPLFDTPRFAGGLERAFERMHARSRAGLPPEGFDVDA